MELESVDAETEYKPVVQDDGTVRLKKKSKVRMGKKSKASGGQFELRVRKDLEGKGWVVDKWSNNVDLKEGKIVSCKKAFRPIGGGRSIMIPSAGFPDFVCFEKRGNLYKVIGIEVKMNGALSREEKLKCSWLLEAGIFSEILVASKIQERKGGKIRVEYVDFLEIGKRMRKS